MNQLIRQRSFLFYYKELSYKQFVYFVYHEMKYLIYQCSERVNMVFVKFQSFEPLDGYIIHNCLFLIFFKWLSIRMIFYTSSQTSVVTTRRVLERLAVHHFSQRAAWKLLKGAYILSCYCHMLIFYNIIRKCNFYRLCQISQSPRCAKLTGECHFILIFSVSAKQHLEVSYVLLCFTTM